MAYRIARLNSLIREELSELLLREAKDPRLSGLISFTHVEVAADIKHAKVYVSVLGEKEEKEKVLKSLISAAGFLRSELAKNLRLRHTPDLDFILDDSIETGARILELLDKVKHTVTE
ncbi:MAG: 30S ribosome-binding factor RbfA [Dehalococcoidia bacterium]|nr:30S ribosome-binding factor RbfA [Dehalococcoidia bacterium]